MKSKKSKSKKKGSKSDTKPSPEKDALSEVDKTFYELQIADLNRKLERLTSLSLELEQRNQELTSSNQKLDEDRADIIAFLKKTVQEQSDEINDLVGRLQGLKATRIAENDDFEKVVTQKDDDFRKMQNELKSEVKLVESKLNALEDFRIQREDLNKKFEDQEMKMKLMANRHKEALYNIERDFVIEKTKLVKQIELKLTKLSEDFNSLTDKRIVETTHRLIRENIALNCEKTKMIEEQKKLQDRNDELISRCQRLRIREETAITQAEISLKRFHIQQKIVFELDEQTEHLQNLQKENDSLKENLHDLEQTLKKEKMLTDKANYEVEILQSELKDCHDKRKLALSELANANDKCSLMTSTLFEAIFNIRHLTNIRKGSDLKEIDGQQKLIDEVEIMSHKESILHDLYSMFMAAKEARRECKNLEEYVQFYTPGCLGMMPKFVQSHNFKERSVGIQVDMSFEDFMELPFSDFVRKSALENQNPFKS